MTTDKTTSTPLMRFILGQSLGAMLAPNANNFAAVRLILALAVLVSHAFMLRYGTMAAEPLISTTGYTLGQHAVQGFFILSGVLVAQSLMHAEKPWHFAMARALRIFPALAVCVVLTAVILGPLVTTWPMADYIKSQGVAAYIVKTIALVTGSAPLPGVFETHAMPGLVNSSLWTLKYEVICYIALGAIGFAALALGRVRDVGLLFGGLLVIAFLARQPALRPDNGALANIQYFALFFALGVLFYAVRRWLVVTPLLLPALVMVAGLAIGTRFAEFAFALTIGYGLLVVGALPLTGPRRFTNDSDYSYGFYIYSVPVTQTLLWLVPNLNVVSLVLATLGFSLLLAFLSWEVIERPAIEFGRMLRRMSKGAAAKIDAASVSQTTKAQPAATANDDAAAPAPSAVQRDVPQAAPAPTAPDNATVEPPPRMHSVTPTTPVKRAPSGATLKLQAKVSDLDEWREWAGSKPVLKISQSMSASKPEADKRSVQQPAPSTNSVNRPIAAAQAPKAATQSSTEQHSAALAKRLREGLARHGLARSQTEIDAELAPASAQRTLQFMRRMRAVAQQRQMAQIAAQNASQKAAQKSSLTPQAPTTH